MKNVSYKDKAPCLRFGWPMINIARFTNSSTYLLTYKVSNEQWPAPLWRFVILCHFTSALTYKKLVAFCQQITIQCLKLLVGWQERLPVCKSSATTIPKNLVLGTGLTWINLTGSNSGKWAGWTKTECVSACSVTVKWHALLSPALRPAIRYTSSSCESWCWLVAKISFIRLQTACTVN